MACSGPFRPIKIHRERRKIAYGVVTAAQLVKDLVAGVIVAIIALPLSIALAIASGVGPEAGIYTAIVAGFIVAFLGGSRVQIAGPTAAFATIVAGIVAKDGTEGLMVATVLAGVLLVLMGLFRFGNLLKVPLRQSSEIHSQHHHHRLHRRHRRHAAHRPGEGFHRHRLSARREAH